MSYTFIYNFLDDENCMNINLFSVWMSLKDLPLKFLFRIFCVLYIYLADKIIH